MMKGNHDIIALGNLSIDELGLTDLVTDSNFSTQIREIHRYYGGRGGNFAVFTKVFGVKTLLLSSLGQDKDGKDYMRYLRGKGLDTSGIYLFKKADTTKAMIFRDDKKTRTFFYNPVSNEAGRFKRHVMTALSKTRSYKIRYCTSGNAELSTPFLSFKKARETFNAFSPGHNIFTYSKKELASCLRHTDILFLNESEYGFVRKLYGNLNRIRKRFGIGMIIITRGENGATLFDGKEHRVPAYRPRRFVDAVGAGDSFAAAFLSTWLQTRDAIRSIKVASAAASFVVEKIGTQIELPTKAMIYSRVKAGRVL